MALTTTLHRSALSLPTTKCPSYITLCKVHAAPRLAVPVVLGVPKNARHTTKVAALFHKEDPVPVDPHHPELVTMRSRAGWKQYVSDIAFWLQLALSTVAATILLSSAGAQTAAPLWPRLLTGVGLVTAVLSAAFAWNFKHSARELKKGGVVTPSWISGNLLRCNALNIFGLAVTILGLQASVGSLVAASMLSGGAAALTASGAPAAMLPLDVFYLQAAASTMLSHIVSMVYTNLLFRFVRSARYTRNGALQSWDGGAALGTMDLP